MTACPLNRDDVERRQLDLLDEVSRVPDGFVYHADLISPGEERDLVTAFTRLDLRPFEFRGYLGKRRVTSFGLYYDYDQRRVMDRPDIPEFLLPLRDRAAAIAGLTSASLQHALVTEYAPGAPIGWHRDRPIFDEVIGVSFISPCRFRLRCRYGAGWRRETLMLAPRSAYILRGAVRHEWEHSIPPAETLRYSVTFRSLAPGLAEGHKLEAR